MKRTLAVIVLILAVVGLALADSAPAVAEDALPDFNYCVRKAGTNIVKGTYVPYAWYDGLPAWKHESENIYLYSGYDPDFEWWTWEISDQMNSSYSAPNQYYFRWWDFEDYPPTGTYWTDWNGDFPDAELIKGSCPELLPIEYDIEAGSTFDGWTGIGGVSSPASGQTGTLYLETIFSFPAFPGYNILKGYDVKIIDGTGEEMDKYYGFLYLYFNLTEKQVEQFNQGNLSIMRYTKAGGWEPMTTFFAAWEDTGRAATLVSQPGVYALVQPK